MKTYPKVSIIIPLYVIEDRFFIDLKKFKDLDYPDYEIIVVCDRKVEIKDPKVKLILTGEPRTGPAEKRDLALKYSKGEICAFIDDDAYPDREWIRNAVGHFKNEQIAAVGGPGLTPPEDDYRAQITGLIYKSYFCGGKTQHRFVKSYQRLVTDYPAYNLFVRTSVLKEVGGYGSYFYGGEDTFLCLKIIKKNYKILYDPHVVVYHHRRPVFMPYLKQIANIGVHRGYFAKEYPETSRKITYFIPSVLTGGFLSGIGLSLLNPEFFIYFLLLLLVAYMVVFLSIIKKSNFIMCSIASLGIILTHLVYGTFFMRGLLTDKLER